MKKEYINPQMTVVIFENEDVITASVADLKLDFESKDQTDVFYY